MKDKKAQLGILIIVLIIIAIGAGVYFYSTSSSQTGNEGRVVFTITDAAADMQGVTQVQVTVDNMQAHSTTEGWVTLSSTSQTYNLLELKSENKLEIIADANISAGTYDQVRMDISQVTVVDSNGSHEAKLPSGELKIFTQLEVNANSTSTATFDFIADESLHITGNGKYILAPVIQVETRADAQVTSDGQVAISNGRVTSNIKVGMDEKGNVGVGLGIASNSSLEIDVGGIKVGSNALIGVN